MSEKWDIENWKKEGAIIGKNVVEIDSFIDRAFPYLVEIGDNTVLTGCRILAHDASIHPATGYSKVGVTKIGKNCFIGDGVRILVGVSIGDNCIIGAGAVVSKDIHSGSVYVGGTEGKIIETTDQLISKHKERIESGKWPVFEKTTNLSKEEKIYMKKALEEKGGYAR